MATKYEDYGKKYGEEVNPYSMPNLRNLTGNANQEPIELQERPRGRSPTPRKPIIRIGHYGGVHASSSAPVFQNSKDKSNMLHDHEMVDISLQGPSTAQLDPVFSSQLRTPTNWPLENPAPDVKNGSSSKLSTAELVKARFYRKQVHTEHEPIEPTQSLDSREAEESKSLTKKLWSKLTTATKHQTNDPTDIEAYPQRSRTENRIKTRAITIALCIIAMIVLLFVLVYFLGVKFHWWSKKHLEDFVPITVS